MVFVVDGPGSFTGKNVSQCGHFNDTATADASSSKHCLYQNIVSVISLPWNAWKPKMGCRAGLLTNGNGSRRTEGHHLEQ
jgi:hypothetical protein